MARYKILLIEDNLQIREVITELLNLHGYDCILAEDGGKGLEMAKEHLPNLIISDVLMPVMNGYELVRKISSDMVLSHIPVIMLTAKSKEEEKIKGLQHGAVDYITKPFNSKELILKIQNLIKSREKFRQSNWEILLSNSFDVDELNEDETFLKQLYEIVIENLENTNFGVPELASQINISERNLYRKVKEVTGVPVATYIREIRLQRAKNLVEKGHLKTISEVAYSVGFKSPKHFSKTYQKRFGRPPK
ncbi:response regulator transcription factor [Gracilimonas sp.]|uniref:response regulator transcription factor n=1 Tax=Gracilimonas sp. TaxID=1974203 RepID=UPI003BA9D899